MGFKAIKIQFLFFVLLVTSFVAKAQCGATISTFPYTEDFEAAPAWTTGGVNSDFVWGAPTHPIINSAGGGTNCWNVGGLTGSFYNYSEQSWIQSPCFDFTTLNYPWISFKIFWEDEWKYDGLVLQSSIDGGITWTNVGAFGDPVDCLNDNWYDYGNITWLNSLPAGTRNGWTGRTGPTAGPCQGGNGSLTWVTAKHCMSSLAGQPSVCFRFLFGSGTTCNGFDGISVDDILIDNAPPNVANFTFACAGANTINFTNTSLMCPTGYFWSFGDGATSTLASPSHTYAAPGTYNVSLTSSGPCNASNTITIPVSILGATTTATNITCNGANDGTATATVIGSAGPIVYSWAPGGLTTANISGLSTGTYTVSVSAAGSCPTTATATITQPATLTASTVVTPVSCFGGTNGTSIVTGSGGTSPYTYNWTPSGGTAGTASGLAAGTYTVTVTDAHSCTTTATAVILQPAAALNVSTTNTPALCGTSNGTANSTTTGGTAAYTYLWSPSGGTTANASSLSAGTYTITVTDAHGCIATSLTTITNIGGVIASAVSTPVLCFGGNSGTGTATGTGGTIPYTYSWSPTGGAAASASGLIAGTYTVSVTDSHGCISTATTTVTQPVAPLAVTTINTPVNCFGGTDGTASCSATGGTSPYTYLWSPSAATTVGITGLSSGIYTITVTDANSCSTIATTNVAQPIAPLSATTSNTPVSCFGGTNGTATAIPVGGTAPYSYSWTPSGDTFVHITGLSSGTYTVTVTDAHSCTTTATASVAQPASALNASIINTATTCGYDNGTAAAASAGGTSPYTYSWSPSGGTTNNASALAPGIYTINVIDANGCIASATTTINGSVGVIASVTSTPISCFGGTNGTASASATGGTGSYSYLWNNEQTSSTITNLSAGNYCVTATDIAGCSNTACSALANPPQMVGDFISDPTTTDILNSTIHFTDESPGSVTWQWSFGDTTGSIITNPVHTYGETGIYPVTLIVTNAQGCKDTVTHDITINDIFTFYAPNAFTPNGNGTNDIFLPKGTGWNPDTFNMWIFDRWGNIIYHTTEMYQGWNGAVKNTDVQNDVYVWKVSLSDIRGKQHNYLGSVTVVK